jgi:ubiquinone/menaquinone biosynthesis C-methylase UbiE
MRECINLLTALPNSNRPLSERKQIPIADRRFHWELDREYFDGTRNQGYGGYKNDGRWDPVALDLSNHFGLNSNACILDVGCAKGYLLESFHNAIKNSENWGLDISKYAVSHASNPQKERLIIGNAKDLPFEDAVFDLVVSINSLHNILNINDLLQSLREISRVSKGSAYVTIAAYSNDTEKSIIDDWAVVATTYMHQMEWLELFDKANYTGDYCWFKPKIGFSCT